MRILLVIDHVEAGGAAQQARLLCSGLLRRGHEVHLFVYSKAGLHLRQMAALGVRVHEGIKTSRFSTRPICALRGLLRNPAIDAAIAFLDTPSLYLELAGVGLARRPVLIASQRSAFSNVNRRWRTRAAIQAYRLADQLVPNSYHARDDLAIHHPWLARRMTTIINGVEFSRFPTPAPLPQATGPLRLLVIARIGAEKNPSGVARALAIVRDRTGAAPILRWAGQIDVMDGGRAHQEACAEIAELGLADSWEWLGPRSDVPALLSEHDALLHPSFFEGFPNAICEALTAGRPVLASRLCDHPWMVAEGERGFLFDPADPSDIAAAILRLQALTGPERARMGRDARAFAERELGETVFLDRYEALLARLVAQKRGGGNGDFAAHADAAHA